ncbi:MAG: hypothetical protein WB502_08145 [Thermoactinomyces sp.]
MAQRRAGSSRRGLRASPKKTVGCSGLNGLRKGETDRLKWDGGGPGPV